MTLSDELKRVKAQEAALEEKAKAKAGKDKRRLDQVEALQKMLTGELELDEFKAHFEIGPNEGCKFIGGDAVLFERLDDSPTLRARLHPNIEDVYCGMCSNTCHVLQRDARGYSFALPCPGYDIERRVRLFNKANIPAFYLGASFDSWDDSVDPLTTARHKQAVSWADNYKKGARGLWWHGGVGVGKTRMMVCIIHHLAFELGVPCLFVRFRDLMDKLKDSFKSRTATKEEVLEPYLTAPVLAIDEVRATLTRWEFEAFDELIDSRLLLGGRTTLVTSNYAPDKLAEIASRLVEPDMLGPIDRALSRLQTMARPVLVEGADYRARE
jgi:DNA replication protein DnaC